MILGNTEDVNRLIKFTPEDAEIVAQVVNASEIQPSFLLTTLLTAEGSTNLSSTPSGHPRNCIHGG
jgi:hypothetical protein